MPTIDAMSTTQTAALREDARTISLIGLAHGSSHFFHMLLPPLFPWFIREFGLNYSELGLLVTTFFVISGIGQALAGFLVDRTGARPVLFAALACFALAALSAATATGYHGLMLAAAQGRWAPERAGAAKAAAVDHPLPFLRLPSVWLCFSFFFWTTAALSAAQRFASPALQTLYGVPLSLTALVVTGYMLCGAAGM